MHKLAHGNSHCRPTGAGFLALLTLVSLLATARAELQFDVFVGYGLGANEGAVAEGAWFPVFFEIFNDGPGFDGGVELIGQSGQPQRVAVELPTGTRKRILMPCFSNGRWLSLEARLRDARGKVRASHSQIRPRLFADRDSPLVGSLSRSLAGAPSLPEVKRANNQLQPAVARLSVELFPDHVIALDGLSALYLHSSRAPELKAPQVTALLAWLHSGGHLILGVEQPGDVHGTPWLAGLLPCEITGLTTRTNHADLQAWLNSDSRQPPAGRAPPRTARPRTGGATTEPPASPNPLADLAADAVFESAPMPVALATLRDGKVLLGSTQAPLAVQCARGRGTLTVLLFSPELEPFKTWKNRSWFWARLTDVPIEWLGNWQYVRTGTYHVDSIFGAMVDSRQIRKLPVTWLFVLLLAYLAVIGPVDQFILKKLNRQMLTWVTFPAYVAFFSLLIYYIGYRLRAGEAEWNEFQVVDVIPHGERADLRGRTYGSVYSPLNAQYPVASDAPCATVRGEVGYHGGAEISKAAVTHLGNSFSAQLQAPIWTSQLFLSDWWRQAAAPLRFTLKPRGEQEVEVAVQNLTGRKIPQGKLILDGRVHALGDLSQSRTLTLSRTGGQALQDYVRAQRSAFGPAVESRRSQWGRSRPATITSPFDAAIAASFMDRSMPPGGPGGQPYQQNYATARGFDLGPNAERGDAILMAWMPEATLAAPMNKFAPKRSHHSTLLRVVTPAASAP